MNQSRTRHQAVAVENWDAAWVFVYAKTGRPVPEVLFDIRRSKENP